MGELFDLSAARAAKDQTGSAFAATMSADDEGAVWFALTRDGEEHPYGMNEHEACALAHRLLKQVNRRRVARGEPLIEMCPGDGLFG